MPDDPGKKTCPNRNEINIVIRPHLNAAFSYIIHKNIRIMEEVYGHVAGLAKRAGFEMLMIHGGHGWLINQFLSPLFNHRTDEYGGSLENRTRFAVEVLKSVREAVGPFFPIEFRMSGAEFCEGGYGLDEGVRIAQAIEPYTKSEKVKKLAVLATCGHGNPEKIKSVIEEATCFFEMEKRIEVFNLVQKPEDLSDAYLKRAEQIGKWLAE